MTIADHIASQNLASGILAALLARHRTGTGQRSDSSQLAGQIWAQVAEYTAYLMSGRVSGRADRRHPLIPGLYGIFTTQDGWIAIVGVVGAVGAARKKFFELVGAPHLGNQFRQPYFFAEEKAELFPQLEALLAARTTEEGCHAFGPAGIRPAPARTHADVVADPAVRENGYVQNVSTPAGDVAVVASPVRFSGTPARVSALAPELGQHTEEILLNVGYTRDEIAALSSEGAI